MEAWQADEKNIIGRVSTSIEALAAENIQYQERIVTPIVPITSDFVEIQLVFSRRLLPDYFQPAQLISTRSQFTQ